MVPWDYIVRQLFYGLVSGCMYALMAAGLSLIFGVMKMLNFAHGEFYMIGGYVIYFLVVKFGVDPMLSIFSALIAAFLTGMLIERVFLRPLFGRPAWDLSALTVTIGLSIFLQNFALVFWGEKYKRIPEYIAGTVSIYGIPISLQRVLVVVGSLCLIAVLWGVLHRTMFGKAIRAVAQDPDAASLMGINPRKIFMLTYAISCMLAAFAGALLSPIFMVYPTMGASPFLKGFCVAIFGGLGSFEGAVLGGMLLGLAEVAGIALFGAEWRDVIAFTLLILTLVFKPSGLLGRGE